jgi:type 1 fimbria pilin
MIGSRRCRCRSGLRITCRSRGMRTRGRGLRCSVAIRRFSTADLTGRKGSSMVGGYGWGWSEMDSIQTVAMGDTPSITFSNLGLGGVYQHLQLRAVLFGATAGMAVVMRFNGVSTANYHSHVLRGTGSAASGGASTGRTSLLLHDDHTNTTNPCALVCDILDYSSTVKTKTTPQMRSLPSLSSTPTVATSGAEGGSPCMGSRGSRVSYLRRY